MRSVRISLKTARAILSHLESCASPGFFQFEKDIRAAMQPKKFVVAARKPRAEKKRTKAAETSDIRAEVFARADGVCELCCSATATDLQHCMGRIKRPQAVSNCLALCRPCHLEATRKSPQTVEFQGDVLAKLGHHQTARDMWSLASWLQAKTAARSALTRGEARNV